MGEIAHPSRLRTVERADAMRKSDDAMPIALEYRRFIKDLKARIAAARISAARAVNRDLIRLYWDIGRGIVEKQRQLGWGESVVERVSRDLRRAFPEATGFSPRNLRDMKRFFLAYSDAKVWRGAVAGLPGVPKRPQPVAKSMGGWPTPSGWGMR
jgi:hypothetical protein